jgi:hypothetical protein
MKPLTSPVLFLPLASFTRKIIWFETTMPDVVLESPLTRTLTASGYLHHYGPLGIGIASRIRYRWRIVYIAARAHSSGRGMLYAYCPCTILESESLSMSQQWTLCNGPGILASRWQSGDLISSRFSTVSASQTLDQRP